MFAERGSSISSLLSSGTSGSNSASNHSSTSPKMSSLASIINNPSEPISIPIPTSSKIANREGRNGGKTDNSSIDMTEASSTSNSPGSSGPSSLESVPACVSSSSRTPSPSSSGKMEGISSQHSRGPQTISPPPLSSSGIDLRTPSPAFYSSRPSHPPQILFESAGSYGLQRNVPFLLRNSSVWRPGILPPAPPTSKSTINTISLSTSSSALNIPNQPHFEYLKLHFPQELCAVDEVTRRNRVQRHPLSSSSSSSLTLSQQQSLLNLKVDLTVFVVKEGQRIRDSSQEVRDVFVVREHPTKVVRRGEELQISVRFHRLPSDFLSSSREFILYVKFIRMPASVPSSSPSSSPEPQDEGVGTIVFESDVFLHSKSRTKPGQSAKEAAAQREAAYISQFREGSGSLSPIRVSPPPMQTTGYPTAYYGGGGGGGGTSWNGSSPSPSPSPGSPIFSFSPSRSVVVPSPTSSTSFSSVPSLLYLGLHHPSGSFGNSDPRSRSASPAASEAAALLSFQKRNSASPGSSSSSSSVSDFGSRAPAMSPLLELCEEADRAAKKSKIIPDNRTEAELEEARRRWKKFLQEVGVEDPEKAAEEMVKEKIEIHQLPSLRFDMLRSLGFLVGDILRMLDHCQRFMKANPPPGTSSATGGGGAPVVVVTPPTNAENENKSENAASLSVLPGSPGLSHVTNRISSISLKQSSGGFQVNPGNSFALSTDAYSSSSSSSPRLRTSPRLRRPSNRLKTSQDTISRMDEEEKEELEEEEEHDQEDEEEEAEEEEEEEEDTELQIDDPYDDEYQEGISDGERKRRRSAFSDPRLHKIGGSSSPYKLRRSTSGVFSSSPLPPISTPPQKDMDVFDALLKLSGSPPIRRAVPALLNPGGRSKLSSSMGAIPTSNTSSVSSVSAASSFFTHTPFTSSPLSISSTEASSSTSTSVPSSSSSSSSSSSLSPSFRKELLTFTPSKVCSQIRETIRMTQRFAEKMVSKISDIHNLENELTERTKEMSEVVKNLEICLAITSPNSSPYSLQEIEAVSRKLGGEEGGGGGFPLEYNSDSSPSIRRAGTVTGVGSTSPSVIALRSSIGRVPHSSSSSSSYSSASDTDTDTGSGFDDEGMMEDDRGDELPFEFQPLAYYIGVIKAHLEIRRPERTRKVSGMKRESLRKEYVLVPIEEASRVLGISTTKLSRAYKSLSILSKCGWVFKGRKRRLRWPTRPLRVLLRYICDKYLMEMVSTYSSLADVSVTAAMKNNTGGALGLILN